ncbi:limonene-1,2-epoxide hydrolase [Streptomyces sp. NRRL B-1677]|uniref:Nuclear transport factor 2 family protein n=1 Tax=Streptomyces klenkii TaxID=1420899 RepID=A0A3B0BGF0_9ACTN|nr:MULTISPECIES: nuclear transport factor 2 family protein [Streptomyces]MBF6047965.1 limonene-1,2-epoxide hydrolase [Streptomyces sp. NRRL B-1677]RKN71458.1 nuclear transport factor 2 family protein [Streptomyces klenkii]
MTVRPDARTVVTRYLQALRTRDVEAIPELIADDAVYRIPGSHPLAGTFRGLDEIGEKFFAPMGELFDPDAGYSVEVSHVLAEGDQVSVECVTRSTTVHGIPYANEISAHFTVRDGKIVSMREYFDTQYFARTLFGQDG